MHFAFSKDLHLRSAKSATQHHAYKPYMSYFTWKEAGLTSDCASLEAMAARFEEAASLMRRMAEQGFELNSQGRQQRITHSDAEVFESWGFVNEEPAVRQLTLISDPSNPSPEP